MKARKVIVEVICFVLMMFWFYEGIYKIAYFKQFGVYITHAPLIHPVGEILKYLIPFGEVGLALSLMVSGTKKASLYSTIGLLILFIVWIMSVYLFAHHSFWPYHAMWINPTWMQKMLISLGLCWMAFSAIVLLNKGVYVAKINSNSLRNNPAGVSR